MLYVKVETGWQIKAFEELACQVVHLVHNVFQEPPWNFDWALGKPNDRPASRECTAWGFCNILFANESDVAMLVDESEGQNGSPPSRMIGGLGAGLPLTRELLPEFGLGDKAESGDYYFLTAAIAPAYRSIALSGKRIYRHLLEARIHAARQRKCRRIFARTIDGVDKIQTTLPRYGFQSLGKEVVRQAGLPSIREYFVLDL